MLRMTLYLNNFSRDAILIRENVLCNVDVTARRNHHWPEVICFPVLAPSRRCSSQEVTGRDKTYCWEVKLHVYF